MKSLAIIRGLVLIGLVSCTTAEERLQLPQPTGPYGVGQRVLRWTDDTRPEAMSDKRGAKRHLVITLLYPTPKEQRGRAAEYFLDFSALRKFLKDPEAKAWTLVSGSAHENAPPALAIKRVPVIVFSPGNEMNAAQYATITHELVSFGYVVAAIDHRYDVRAVVLPDGEVAKFADSHWLREAPARPSRNPAEAPFWKMYRERVRVRVEDAVFVLSRLQEFSRQEPAFSEVIDFKKTGFAGHSIGGVAAGQACRSDTAFLACLNLDGSTFDGPFFPDEQATRAQAAYMMITKPFIPNDERLRQWGLSRDQWLANYKNRQAAYFCLMARGSYKVTIDQATHSSFSDDALIIAAGTKSPEAERHKAVTAQARRYAVDFFDTHLKGSPSLLLTEATPAWTGVTMEKW